MRVDLAGVVLDDRYQVIEPIAAGAMGVVYRAERLKLGRIVAIKVLHDALPDELASRKRFEIEAMAMAKLEHPHCAAVVDVGVYDGKPYVVMDYVSGDNLKTVMAPGPLPPSRAVELMRQILSGLSHAHELGIVHRDVKPANIMLSQKAGLGDHVKILDFGLARFATQGPRLTQGIAVGTPSYMAPEQGTGGAVDARTDVYACGIVLYEMLAGTKPFHSLTDDPVEVVRMHLTRPAPRLDAKFGMLVEVVAKALAKKPADRFQSADEFAAALRGGSQPAIPLEGMQSSPVPVAREELSWSVPQDALPPPEVSIATAPTLASTEVVPRPVVSTRPSPFTTRRLAIGGIGVVLLVVIIAAATSGGSIEKTTVPGDAAVAKVTPPPRPADVLADTIARANSLIAANRTEEAIKVLQSGRTLFPTDPQLPLTAGKLYFSKLWFTDGLAAFRAAVKNDPGLATDPELVKTVLRGFITTPRYDAELAEFLHDVVGPSVKPMLAETAKDHPNATVRARAASELKRYR